MILIWSGDGGPLQFLGLAVFCLQFIAPHLFRLSIDLQTGAVDFGFPQGFPYVWLACSVAIAVAMGGAWVVWEWGLGSGRQETGPQQQPDDANDAGNDAPAASTAGAEAAPAAPLGSTANPIVIDDDDNDNDHLWTRIANRLRSLARSFSPTHLLLALGFALPLAMMAPLFIHGREDGAGVAGLVQESGVVQITVLAIVAHSMMAIAAYRVLRDVLDAGGVGPYPGHRRGGRRRGRKLTVAEIADLVRKVPVEEYVSEEDITNGECSVARMKRMLVNRGAAEAAERCVERDDLAKEVERVRKCNDECAICHEEYAAGDVLRVSHCRHEFHLHCFDRWIYTFATDSRPATHPTCPLCKATLQ